MKIELCHFSQQKIYPSRGKKFVRVDGKTFNFANGKSEKSYFMKRNPRKTSWTVLYRRKHKKGTVEEVSKKRSSKKTVKFQRGYGGVTLEAILSKRNQNPEVRKKQREQAIKAAKEKAAAKKKTQMLKATKAVQQKVQQKAAKKGQAPKGGTSSKGGQRR